MIKLAEVESKESAPESQARKSAFVFPNPYTLEVYESLRECCAAEIERLIAAATAEAKSQAVGGDDAENLMRILGEKISCWMVDNNPLWDSGFEIEDAYFELVVLALEEVNFSIVAKAFLEDVVI